MKPLLDLGPKEAAKHFLKRSSYYNGDFPSYIDFAKVLRAVKKELGVKTLTSVSSKPPGELSGVNYNFITNKDGRFSWRPHELIHPVIYVALVRDITAPDNWKAVQNRFKYFRNDLIEVCSEPVVSSGSKSDKAAQIGNWWVRVEQQSLKHAMSYSHLLHTDVVDCYGSLYTHSISWAMHGLDYAKKNKNDFKLLGNQIDRYIQAGRFGQTNGIPQGSVLMDFLAELVLGFVDSMIFEVLGSESRVRILRYRDDYRIFSNSDLDAEIALQVVSDKLRLVGMRLGTSKTVISQNVVEGSIKADKLAAIDLNDLGRQNAPTTQKRLLRIHSFGRKYRDSGSLKRLLGRFYDEISKAKKAPQDIDVQIAIAVDIAFESPSTFPMVAAILSKFISLKEDSDKKDAWRLVQEKMRRVPYNGYLEVWLQRVIKPEAVGLDFSSDAPLCRIVNGEEVELWENSWISDKKVRNAVKPSAALVGKAEESTEVVQPEEVQLFLSNAYTY